MENTLSVTRAYGAGFRLISAAPLAPLVWGLATILLFSPIYVMMWPIMTELGPTLAQMAAQPTPVLPPSISRLIAVDLLSIPLFLIWWAMIMGAVLRAVITPGERKFAYLRLTASEGWMILVALVQGIFGVLALMAIEFVVMIPMAGIMAAMVAAGGGTNAAAGIGFVMLPALLLIYGVWGYFFARFSMALPMTFAQRRFRLFESWTFTRGKGWRLLGLLALVFVTLICIELAVFAVIFGAGLAFGFHPLDMFKPGSPVPNFSAMAPLMIGGVVVGALVGGYFQAFMLAPWADAFNQITGPKGVEELF